MHLPEELEVGGRWRALHCTQPAVRASLPAHLAVSSDPSDCHFACDAIDCRRCIAQVCINTCSNGGTLDTTACTCSCPAGFIGNSCNDFILANWESVSPTEGRIAVKWSVSPDRWLGDGSVARYQSLPAQNSQQVAGTSLPMTSASGSLVFVVRDLAAQKFPLSVLLSLGKTEFGTSKGFAFFDLPLLTYDTGRKCVGGGNPIPTSSPASAQSCSKPAAAPTPKPPPAPTSAPTSAPIVATASPTSAPTFEPTTVTTPVPNTGITTLTGAPALGTSSAGAACVFQDDVDGDSQSEKLMGAAESREDCAKLVMEKEPSANAVAFPMGNGKRCYAQFGATGFVASKGWQACILSADSGAWLQRDALVEAMRAHGLLRIGMSALCRCQAACR